MGTFIDHSKMQYSTKDGILHILEKNTDGSPKAVVPIYVIGQNQILPGEYFGVITNREAPGIEPLYAISNYGRIWHIYKEEFMVSGYSRGGYVRYVLQMRESGPKSFDSHRLMMLKFRYFEGCDDISIYEVNHKDCDKTHNVIDSPFEPDNLEWITKSGNIKHAYENGLMHEYDRDYYTEDQIHNVCHLLQMKEYTYNQIEDLTRVKYGTIAQIKLRKQWTDISKYYNF